MANKLSLTHVVSSDSSRRAFMILGAVYELSKSYDQVFIVIGVVYVVDALVFGAAAMLQTLRRRQRRRLSATTTSPANFDSRGGTRFQPSADFHLTNVSSAPIVTVPPLFSTYGAVVAKAGSATGQHVGENGKADIGKRRDQTGTTSAVHAE